jgi:hypothetical protein
MSIDVGTIGSTPGQVALNKILMEHNNPDVTHAVMSRWMKLSDQLSKLQKYVRHQDAGFYSQMLEMIQRHQFQAIEDMKVKLPEKVYTHLRCSVTALFRKARRVSA